jgi:hypothetical protein
VAANLLVLGRNTITRNILELGIEGGAAEEMLGPALPIRGVPVFGLL